MTGVTEEDQCTEGGMINTWKRTDWITLPSVQQLLRFLGYKTLWSPAENNRTLLQMNYPVDSQFRATVVHVSLITSCEWIILNVNVCVLFSPECTIVQFYWTKDVVVVYDILRRKHGKQGAAQHSCCSVSPQTTLLIFSSPTSTFPIFPFFKLF